MVRAVAEHQAEHGEGLQLFVATYRPAHRLRRHSAVGRVRERVILLLLPPRPQALPLSPVALCRTCGYHVRAPRRGTSMVYTRVRPPFTWPLEPNVSTASSPSKAAHECGSKHRLVHRRCGTLGEHTHTDIHQDAHSVISKTSPQIFVLDSSTFPSARPS